MQIVLLGRPRGQLAAHRPGRNWSADARDPVHRAATYPEVITPHRLLVSPDWRPFAMSASAADRDRLRAEFQRPLPPAYHELDNTDLQLFDIVRHAPVVQWHQPAIETVAQQDCTVELDYGVPATIGGNSSSDATVGTDTVDGPAPRVRATPR